jgi:hypothetical protein
MRQNPAIRQAGLAKARILLEQYPRLSGRELHEMSGLSVYMAKKLVSQRRHGGGETLRSRVRTPGAVQWEKLERFMNAHPGQTFTRGELSEATGVPVTTISSLFRQRTGQTFSESDQASDTARSHGSRALGRPAAARFGAAAEIEPAPELPYEEEDEGEEEEQPGFPAIEVAMFSDYALGYQFTVVGQSRQGAAIIADTKGNLFHPVRS